MALNPRVLLGNLGGGDYGLRVSKPGFDVTTEALGSNNICFDSRSVDFGIFHKRGVWIWGDPIITFPTLPYVPLVSIQRIDSSNRVCVEDAILTPNVVSTVPYFSTSFVGIVTESTLEIRKFDIPWYTVDFTGLLTKFLYTIYAIEVT